MIAARSCSKIEHWPGGGRVAFRIESDSKITSQQATAIQEQAFGYNIAGYGFYCFEESYDGVHKKYFANWFCGDNCGG